MATEARTTVDVPLVDVQCGHCGTELALELRTIVRADGALPRCPGCGAPQRLGLAQLRLVAEAAQADRAGRFDHFATEWSARFPDGWAQSAVTTGG